MDSGPDAPPHSSFTLTGPAPLPILARLPAPGPRSFLLSDISPPVESTAEGSPGTAFADVSWNALGLSPEVVSSLEAAGYARPTPVQAQAVPAALAGRDILCRSKTGTGKTAAFLLPMIEKMVPGGGGPQGLVLCPTRELALQVAAEAERLVGGRGLRVVTLYGGVGLGSQTEALRAGVELAVGTPGRVLDHLRRGNFDTRVMRFGCLDEADEMLSMGFYEEVTAILDKMPKSRQMLLFSATVEEEVRRLIQRYLKDPEEIFLSTDVRTVDGITHVLYETVSDYPKPRQVLHLIDRENPDSGIIFCNTREDTNVVARFLSQKGVDAEPLSSDLSQKARERVMGRIKRGEIRFLVATDIAARGIDISDLTHVINYSLPEDPAIYLHRVGRTGRIGKTGTAISLWSGREMHTRRILKQTYNIEFQERKLPSLEEARALFTERHVDELKSVMGQVAYEGYLPMVEELKKRPDGDVLLAVALRGFFIWHRMEMKRRAIEAGGENYEEVMALTETPSRSRAEEPRRGGRGDGRSGGGRNSGGRSGGGRSGEGRGHAVGGERGGSAPPSEGGHEGGGSQGRRRRGGGPGRGESGGNRGGGTSEEGSLQ